MDFPDFFKLTRVNDFIKSSRWRGLALLSSPINAGSQVDQVTAATGDLFTDRDSALHVIVKPMQSVIITPTTGVVTALTAKIGIRYFIHGIEISARLVAGDTTTNALVTGTVNGTAQTIAIVNIVPSAAGAYNYYSEVDLLLDENTLVSGACTTANPTAASVILYYNEVGAK